MRFLPVLRLLLAGLLAGSALLAPSPWPLEQSPSLDPRSVFHVPSAHADPGDWPMFHYDPAHSGYNPNESALKPPLRLKWTFATANQVYSTPAVANGAVYVGSMDKNIYALSAQTGALLWSYRASDSVRSSPAVADGAVYVGSNDGKLYALDAATGSLKWSYSIAVSWSSILPVSSPVVTAGVVYVGSSGGGRLRPGCNLRYCQVELPNPRGQCPFPYGSWEDCLCGVFWW